MERADLLADRYLLGDVIGRGGMGVVQRAWDTHLNRYVAVKRLLELTTDPQSRDRFGAEGRTLAGLNHPGLITLFDAGAEGDEPYLVMELVDGVALSRRCHGTPMAVVEVASIGARLADALAYVHRRQFVHRDVKPSNVLLADDGRIKLADFGIARLVDNVNRDTATGITVGTAAYLSPEQVRDQAVGVSSDIYSLGLVLIEALTGAPVFAGHPVVVAAARLTRSPQVDENLPGRLRRLLEAMTATQPLARPSAEQVARELRDVLSESGPAPTDRPLPQPQPLSLAALVGDAQTVDAQPTGPVLGQTLPIPVGPPPVPQAADSPRHPAHPQPGAARRPTVPAARSGRAGSRVLAVVAIAVVVVAGLMFGPLRDRPAGASASPKVTAASPAHAGGSGSGTTVVDDAKAQAQSAVAKAKASAVKKAQREARKLERAAQKKARQALRAAQKKAESAVDDALNGIKDAVTGGGKAKSG